MHPASSIRGTCKKHPRHPNRDFPRTGGVVLVCGGNMQATIEWDDYFPISLSPSSLYLNGEFWVSGFPTNASALMGHRGRDGGVIRSEAFGKLRGAKISRIKAKNRRAPMSWSPRGVPAPIVFLSSNARLHAAACNSSLFCTFFFPRT